MPLSTSNFNQQETTCNYKQLWLTVLFLVLATGLCLEIIYRKNSHLPSVVDNATLWSFHRSKASSGTSIKQLVIIGTSRAQLALNPAVLKESLPDYEILHLAISGNAGKKVFQDLCADPEFKGVIIWDTWPGMLYHSVKRVETEIEFLDYFYHQFYAARMLDKNLNNLIAGILQNFIVIFSPELTLRKVFDTGFCPGVNYLSCHFNRYRSARYHEIMSESDRTRHRDQRISQALSDQTWLPSEIQYYTFLKNEFQSITDQLYLRGGQVILIHLPVSGELGKIAEQTYPKKDYWDVITSLTGFPTIHFSDYKTLSGFTCPDGSHLDAQDAILFSKNLAEILKSSHLPSTKLSAK